MTVFQNKNISILKKQYMYIDFIKIKNKPQREMFIQCKYSKYKSLH